MLNENTLSKMKEMNLTGMYDAFKLTLSLNDYHKMTCDQLAASLVDAEYDYRQNKRLAQKLSTAKLRYPASAQQVDFNADRKLDRNLFMRLAECSYIKHAENIIISGMTGTGKSYIACALGHQACMAGYKVVYHNFNKLMSKLVMSRGDNSYLKEINKIASYDLLIIDDFGLQTMDHASNISLLEILEDRYGSKSTIIASQIPPENWYALFNSSTIADACLDRIIHNAHKMDITGESMRKNKKVAARKKNG